MRTFLIIPTLALASLSLIGCGGNASDDNGSTGSTSTAGAAGAGASGAGAGGAGAGAGGAGAGGAGAGGAGAGGAGAGGASAGGASAGGAGAGAGGVGGALGGAGGGSAGKGTGGAAGGTAGSGTGGGGGAAGGTAGSGTGGGGGAAGGTAGGATGGFGGFEGVVTPIPAVPANGVTSLDWGDAKDAWKTLGMNVDGLTSTTASTDHCALVPGTKPADVLVDGQNGIDNSFAHNVVPIFTGLDSSFSTWSEYAIGDGGDTLALLPLGTGSDPASFPLAIVRANGGSVPGTQAWKAFADEVSSTSPLIAGAQFPGGTKTGSTVSSGITGGVVIVPMTWNGYPAALRVYGARTTLAFAPDATAKGVLGGWLKTDELTDEIKRVGGMISTQLCSGSAAEGVKAQLEMASDILDDGTQSPNKTCNGVSFGIGFKTKPGVVDGTFTRAPAPDTCAN